MNPSDRPRLRPRLRLPATPVPVAAPESDPSSLSLGGFLSTGSTIGPARTASLVTSPTASATATAAPSPTPPMVTRTATTNATAAAPTTAPATAAEVPLFGGVVDFGFSKTPDGQRLRPHSRPPRRRSSLSPAPLHLVSGHPGGTPTPSSALGRLAPCSSSPPSSRSPSPQQQSVSMFVASRTYKHKPTFASAARFTSKSTSKSTATATATATGLDASTTATTTLSGMRAAGDFHVDLLDDVEEMCQVMVSFGSVQDRLGRERERKSSRPLVQRPVRLRRRTDGSAHTTPAAAATAAASTGPVRDQNQ